MTEREEKPKEGFFQKVKHLFKHDKKDERDYMDENTIGGQNKDAEVSRPIPIGVTYPNPSNQSNIKEENHLNQPKTTGEIGSEQYVHHIGKSKEPQDSSLIKEDQKDSNFLKEHQNKDLKPKEVITTVKKEKKFDEPRQKEKEKYKEGEHQMKQPKQKKEKEVIKSVKIDENESNLEKREKQRDYDKESLKQKPKEVDLITTVKKVSKFNEGTDEYKKGEMNSTPKEVITTVEKEIIYGKKKEGEYPREELKETKPIHKDSDLDNEIERDRNMEGQTNNLQNPQIIQSKDENVIVIPEKRDNVIIIQEPRNENVNVLPGQQNISTFQEPRNQNVQPLTNTGLITQPASDTQLGDISGNKGETVIKIVEKQIGNDKDIHIYLDDKKNDSQGLNTGNF